MENEIWLKDVAVFLAAAGIAAPFFRAMKQSAVLAFLLAGVLLGPLGLGRLVESIPWLHFVTISNPHAVEPMAEAGILFLLFMLGLELSFGRLWALRKDVFGLGAFQVLLSAALIGGAVMFFGVEAGPASIIGLALALSSTAIVMQILIEERKAATPAGRTAFSVLLFQDIMVAPILILVGFLGIGGGSVLPAIAQAVIGGGLAIAFIALMGRFAVRPAFRLAASAGGREMMLALTFLAVLVASAATAYAGLSLALGAFLAGLLLGETEFKTQIEIDLEPFKGLLIGLFFMTVGMGIDPLELIANWPVILGGAAALILGKSLLAYSGARLFGKPRHVGVQAAALLGPSGEFAFVIVGAAVTANVIGGQLAVLITAIAGLSMLVSPLFARAGSRLAGRLLPGDLGVGQNAPEESSDGHVIIAGYGRVGRMLGELLLEENAEIIAIDSDPKRIAQCQKDGIRIFYGDAGRVETLMKAGLESASQIIVTVDNPDKAERVVKAVRSRRKDASITARATDRKHADRLIMAGASFVVHEVAEAALQLAVHALQDFGMSSDTARARIARAREEIYGDPEWERSDEA
ncbi:cation:proton antiporter [Hyphobacterium sp. CCMP332]|uniref:cation:proton antiporter domain-containing protein n=1 Tax=Hyphobacterium sp. CCMP332 TaxID=2749086 RepID=UPI00164F28B9|nr:cation:proton antiporter [Hyphobacterium sp. CCMP332]QNL18393.1 cation:proton antiporter [Hyphobacterium sp. CCMP332]